MRSMSLGACQLSVACSTCAFRMQHLLSATGLGTSNKQRAAHWGPHLPCDTCCLLKACLYCTVEVTSRRSAAKADSSIRLYSAANQLRGRGRLTLILSLLVIVLGLKMTCLASLCWRSVVQFVNPTLL